MCRTCDNISRADSECDGGPDCICHEVEASCQPSSTDASAGSGPYSYPPIFEPFPFEPFPDVSGGDTGETGSDCNDPNYQLLVDTHDVMSPGRMDKLMREFFEHLMEKCQRKNKAYAETDATSDALNNFREAAADYNITMTKYAHILQGKHYRAFKTWMRTGEAPDKPFRILGDIIVYALLMYCIGIDEGKWKHEQEVLEDGD